LILRITRTFPRNKFNGIGLSSYYLQKFSKEPNLIFTKKINSKPIAIGKKNLLKEIDYQDFGFKKNNNFSILYIILSKIYGELIYFLNIFFFLKKENIRPTLIHVHSINYIFTGIFLKKIFNVPLYLNLGGTDYYRLKEFKILKFITQNVNKVFTVSKVIFNNSKKIIKNNNFFFTSNGIDLSIFKYQNIKKKKQFIAVGNLRWQKNYDKMIKAFNIFAKKNSEYKLIIIGEGEERYKISKLISSFKLDNRVILLGYQSHKKISRIINQSQVFLMSSISEGMPKSLMEAIACATPVITTNAGDCSLIAKNCGLILSKKCSEITFANSIVSIIKNKKRYSAFKKNCIKKSIKFDWQKYCDYVFKNYDKSF
jgi:glycosyltransferase involved in cell wall biosynthesis